MPKDRKKTYSDLQAQAARDKKETLKKKPAREAANKVAGRTSKEAAKP
jgi:hypothetical protein